MPNRFQITAHKLAYDFIAARDGEHCIKCKAKPAPVLGETLQIDHADNNPQNWAPDNLHFLCQNDNLEMRGKTVKEHKELMALYSARNERERERERGREGTSLVKELVDFKSASPEMKANSYYELQFRDWVLITIKQHGFITKKDAINSGAEVVGCSTLTATRYLDKLTSSVGVLHEYKDATGTMCIGFKVNKEPEG